MNPYEPTNDESQKRNPTVISRKTLNMIGYIIIFSPVILGMAGGFILQVIGLLSKATH